MVSTNEFKTGLTIALDKEIYIVMEFMHVKPGKGGAFVRTRLKNMRTGALIDYTFNAGIKVEKAQIDKVEMQYIYNQSNNYVFMNTDTYEQIEIPEGNIESEKRFLTEGLTVSVIFYQTEILGIILPDKVALEVIKSDPAIKGDTKTNALKDAILSTGYLVKVPMFIEQGEKVIVNTQTGDYVSRDKQ